MRVERGGSPAGMPGAGRGSARCARRALRVSGAGEGSVGGTGTQAGGISLPRHSVCRLPGEGAGLASEKGGTDAARPIRTLVS